MGMRKADPTKTLSVFVAAAMLVFAVSSCSGTKKDVPPEFIQAFEHADKWIAIAGVIEEVDSFYMQDAMNAIEDLMVQADMYKSTQTSKVGLNRIYNDLSVLFTELQNMGDNPGTELLRSFHADWMKLRDRFEPYVPAAKKPPPEPEYSVTE